MDKRLLRKIHMEELARMQESRMLEADLKICKSILQSEEYRNAEKLFLYVSVGKEVGTRKLISQAISDGKKVYIPICYGGGIMHAARLRNEDELLDGRYGIPTVSEESEKALPEELDFILVPGVCFDRRGNRLGRGGGYYDRYLANDIRASLVGVCRKEQLLDYMNVDEHDRKVHVIISDEETLRIK